MPPSPTEPSYFYFVLHTLGGFYAAPRELLFLILIASPSRHCLSPLSTNRMPGLATTPVGELLGLPTLRQDWVKDSLRAYPISKCGTTRCACWPRLSVGKIAVSGSTLFRREAESTARARFNWEFRCSAAMWFLPMVMAGTESSTPVARIDRAGDLACYIGK
jgi:hypothetical protein